MRRLLLILPVLALAIALPGAAGGHTTAAKTYTIKTGDDFFSPTSKTIHVNDILKFVWVGEDKKPGSTINEHTIVDATADKWKSAAKTSGTFKRRFKKAGKFTVVCGEHPEDMILKVKVVK
jgi:plastocyanin